MSVPVAWAWRNDFASSITFGDDGWRACTESYTRGPNGKSLLEWGKGFV